MECVDRVLLQRTGRNGGSVCCAGILRPAPAILLVAGQFCNGLGAGRSSFINFKVRSVQILTREVLLVTGLRCIALCYVAKNLCRNLCVRVLHHHNEILMIAAASGRRGIFQLSSHHAVIALHICDLVTGIYLEAQYGKRCAIGPGSRHITGCCLGLLQGIGTLGGNIRLLCRCSAGSIRQIQYTICVGNAVLVPPTYCTIMSVVCRHIA